MAKRTQISFKTRDGKGVTFLLRRRPKHIHDFDFLFEIRFEKDIFLCYKCECGEVKWEKSKEKV